MFEHTVKMQVLDIYETVSYLHCYTGSYTIVCYRVFIVEPYKFVGCIYLAQKMGTLRRFKPTVMSL
jgi:hypothetical protein